MNDVNTELYQRQQNINEQLHKRQHLKCKAIQAANNAFDVLVSDEWDRALGHATESEVSEIKMVVDITFNFKDGRVDLKSQFWPPCIKTNYNATIK